MIHIKDDVIVFVGVVVESICRHGTGDDVSSDDSFRVYDSGVHQTLQGKAHQMFRRVHEGTDNISCSNRFTEHRSYKKGILSRVLPLRHAYVHRRLP